MPNLTMRIGRQPLTAVWSSKQDLKRQRTSKQRETQLTFHQRLAATTISPLSPSARSQATTATDRANTSQKNHLVVRGALVVIATVEEANEAKEETQMQLVALPQTPTQIAILSVVRIKTATTSVATMETPALTTRAAPVAVRLILKRMWSDMMTWGTRQSIGPPRTVATITILTATSSKIRKR